MDFGFLKRIGFLQLRRCDPLRRYWLPFMPLQSSILHRARSRTADMGANRGRIPRFSSLGNSYPTSSRFPFPPFPRRHWIRIGPQIPITGAENSGTWATTMPHESARKRTRGKRRRLKRCSIWCFRSSGWTEEMFSENRRCPVEGAYDHKMYFRLEMGNAPRDRDLHVAVNNSS
jgi:hypothetical protein